MNLLSWLDALAGLSAPAASSVATTAAASLPAPAAEAPPTSRRTALARLGRTVAGAAPLLAIAPTAFARPDSLLTDGFNLELRVARLQQALLAAALATGGLLPADARPTVQVVHDAVAELVTELRTAVERSGAAPEQVRTYDFTGGGGMPAGPLEPLARYADFLALSQGLADLLVRTLLGQIGTATANGLFANLTSQALGAAARQAAVLRRRFAGTTPQRLPWVVGTEADVSNPVLARFYAGEDTTSQSGVLLPGVVALQGRQPDAYTAAFDEPLNPTQVAAALAPFLA